MSGVNRHPHTPYTLRAAKAEDVAFLYMIARETMRTYVEATWGEWNEEWQCKRFAERFSPTQWQIIVVEVRAAGGVCIEYRPDEL